MARSNHDNEDEIASHETCIVYIRQRGKVVFYPGYGTPEDWNTVVSSAARMSYRIAKIIADTYGAEVVKV